MTFACFFALIIALSMEKRLGIETVPTVVNIAEAGFRIVSLRRLSFTV